MSGPSATKPSATGPMTRAATRAVAGAGPAGGVRAGVATEAGLPSDIRPGPRAAVPGRRSGGRAGTVRPAEATAAGLLALFVATLLLPINLDVAGLRLTPVRLFLLASFVPLLLRLLTGAAGRLTLGDLFFSLYGVWIGVAIVANHGPSRLDYAGISIAEALGSYLVGRVLVRNITDYRTFFRYFLTALALMSPFLLLEILTGRLYFSALFDPLFDTHMKVMSGEADRRMGLYRAQGVLEHPILWGVFCSIAIANAYYLYREPWIRRMLLTGFATGMTFVSLSSGAVLAAALQLGMISWGWITRNAWWLLAGLIALGYVAIDLVSNRSPVQVLISHLTFSPANAYWRLHIWNYGSAEVLRNPLFGIGLRDWTRPGWMATASVDNFWLNTAIRYGLPGFVLLAAGIAANLVETLRATLPADLGAARSGYVIALVGTLLSLSTVHIWGATAALIMFYFGAGCWLFTPRQAAPAPVRGGPPAPDPGADPGSDPAPGPAGTAAAGRRAPTREERLARRRADYSRQRP